MVELDQFKYTLSTYDETLKEVKDSLCLLYTSDAADE